MDHARVGVVPVAGFRPRAGPSCELQGTLRPSLAGQHYSLDKSRLTPDRAFDGFRLDACDGSRGWPGKDTLQCYELIR